MRFILNAVRSCLASYSHDIRPYAIDNNLKVVVSDLMDIMKGNLRDFLRVKKKYLGKYRILLSSTESQNLAISDSNSLPTVEKTIGTPLRQQIKVGTLHK